MKNNCVLCFTELVDSEERYMQHGNFCPSCISECNNIAGHFPFDPPMNASEQRIEEYNDKKESYDRLCKYFQAKLANIRLYTLQNN